MIKVEYVKRLVQTPAWPLTFKAIVELQEQDKLMPTFSGLSYQVEGFVAYDDNKELVGFIAFEFEEWDNTYSIGLAYVRPEHRRKGAHTLMFNALVDRMHEHSVSAITSGTHINNVEAQAAFERQGRVATFIRYRYYNRIMS